MHATSTRHFETNAFISVRTIYSASWWRVVAAVYDTTTLLRGAIVNRTYGIHNTLYISLFLLLITIFGPIYYGPPKHWSLYSAGMYAPVNNTGSIYSGNRH